MGAARTSRKGTRINNLKKHEKRYNNHKYNVDNLIDDTSSKRTTKAFNDDKDDGNSREEDFNYNDDDNYNKQRKIWYSKALDEVNEQSNEYIWGQWAVKKYWNWSNGHLIPDKDREQ